MMAVCFIIVKLGYLKPIESTSLDLEILSVDTGLERCLVGKE